MFMFDVETLDIESTAVVLSAAIIHFDVEDCSDNLVDMEEEFNRMLRSACFVKFDAKEQIKQYKRTIQNNTLTWWGKQHPAVKKVSLDPSPEDVSVIEGVTKIKDYIRQFNEKETTIWARGSLDQPVIDSLCRAAEIDIIAQYNFWRDVRTAVDILAVTGGNGYCQFRYPFDIGAHVVKHNPIHDCAYDILMLKYYK